MLSCDLHIHTDHSRDGESSVEEVIRRAESAGLDAVAITDHDTVSGALYALSVQTRLVVIPGIEVSTRQGHLLVLGVKVPLPRGLDIGETIRMQRRWEGWSSFPTHSTSGAMGGKRIDAWIHELDAIEVFNSRYIVGSANKKAEKVAERLGKPCVGGSDAHNARFVGYGRTLVESERDVTAILDAIRTGENSCLWEDDAPPNVYSPVS